MTPQEPLFSRIPSSMGRKLALLTGGGAAALTSLPSDSPAAIQPSMTLPITSPQATLHIPWDVDGDSTADLDVSGYAYNWVGAIQKLRAAGLSGSLVIPSSDKNGLSKLAAGFVVGATLAAGYKIANVVSNGLTLWKLSTTHFARTDKVNFGWSRGETGDFGFAFKIGTDTHYGWAEISYGAGGGEGFTINQAYYNDVAGQSILVGQIAAVPEPSCLGLLAMGAAGLAVWRGQRRKAA